MLSYATLRHVSLSKGFKLLSDIKIAKNPKCLNQAFLKRLFFGSSIFEMAKKDSIHSFHAIRLIKYALAYPNGPIKSLYLNFFITSPQCMGFPTIGQGYLILRNYHRLRSHLLPLRNYSENKFKITVTIFTESMLFAKTIEINV